MKGYLPQSIVCLREGYDRKRLLGDLVAGLTVGVVALPLAMAFAIASGVPPERGIFTAIVAGFLVSALGGSRVLVGGPTGAFVVIVYSIVQRHGYDGLATATFLAGVIIVVMGIARFGRMIQFIPYPVTMGFTSGIAVLILSQQLKDLFGLRVDDVPAELVEKLRVLVEHAGTWNASATAVGLGSLALLLVLRRLIPRVPGPIAVVVVAAVVVEVFRLPVDTIGSRFGGIPGSLPVPALPDLSPERIPDLLPAALTIAFLGAVESLLAAVVADGMTGFRHRPDTELVGQGVANVGAVLFGGIPATGAIARTVTNVKAGGRTPLAGIVHAAVLLVILLAAAPLAAAVPLPALSAILVLVAFHMAEIRTFGRLLRAPRSDVAVLLATFLLTVLVDLTLAVGVGLVLASLLFMRRMAEVADVSAITGSEPEEEEEGPRQPLAPVVPDVPPGVQLYQVRGPFFFGVADRFKDTLQRMGEVPRVLVLRLRQVPVIDATGLHALEDLVARCERQGTKLLLTALQPRPRSVLERAGLLARIGPESVLPDLAAALVRARELLQGGGAPPPGDAPSGAPSGPTTAR